MSDVERLQALFDAGTLLRPSAAVPNAVDLSRAVARLAGDPKFARAGGAGVRELANTIGRSTHIVFVVADGLGMNLVESLGADAFLRSYLSRELLAVFPSTTASALTTMATGEWPAQHAVVGWWTHLPEIGGPATILPFTDRATNAPLARRDVTAATAFPLESRVSHFSRSAVAIHPESLFRSVYTGYSMGRAIRRGYSSMADGIERVVARVEAAPGDSFTYLYMPNIDNAEHTTGTEGDATRNALDDVNRELERLVSALPPSATVIVTSDHGHLDAYPAEPMLIREGDEIGRMLRFAPAGDARVNCYHVREDAFGRFADAFAEHMPDSVVLLTPDEVESLELLGPGELAPKTRARLGDFVAIATDAAVFAWAGAGADGPDMSRLVSHHSGLSPDEMRVPLIVASGRGG